MLITYLTTMMKFLLFAFLFAGIVRAQIIAPCVTQCTIAVCPKGVSDHPCFCVAQYAVIQSCINATCDQASIEDGQMIYQQQCVTLYKIIFADVFYIGGSPGTSSSAAVPASASASASAGKCSPWLNTANTLCSYRKRDWLDSTQRWVSKHLGRDVVVGDDVLDNCRFCLKMGLMQ